jgi:hypothetical protein
MSKEEAKIDLKRFKRHERKFPWALIRKILIAAVLLGLVYYLNTVLKNRKEETPEEFEIEVET